MTCESCWSKLLCRKDVTDFQRRRKAGKAEVQSNSGDLEELKKYDGAKDIYDHLLTSLAPLYIIETCFGLILRSRIETMLEIEIINATLVSSGSHRDSVKSIGGLDTFCIVRIFNKEIGRSSISYNTYEPIWNAKFERQYEELALLEKVHQRPLFFEYFEVEVYEVKSNGEKQTKIYEARIPLINVSTFKGYKLLRASGSEAKDVSQFEYGRLFVRMNRTFTTETYKNIPQFYYAQLCDVCPVHSPYYRHLYLDFDWSPLALTYHYGLAGPVSGELLLDRHDLVEWRTPSAVNSFGDRLSGFVKGTLLITDLRVIFLPVSISLPFKTLDLLLTDHSCSIREDSLVLLHKYTIQFSIAALEDVKSNTFTASANDHMIRQALQFRLLNEQVYEFIICRPARRHSNASTITNDNNQDLYYKGLSSSFIDPNIWCSRVQDLLLFEIRLDSVWLRWAKYLKRTCSQFITLWDRQWLKKAKAPFNLDTDYKRMYVQDLNWRLSDLNNSYHLCPTYPSVLVFPGCLDDEAIIAAASQRSIGRLPALVWLHPETKAPLCRAAQPMAGLSGSAIEFDKKMCLSIKASCPHPKLPLRIADARPKLNANANAMQGKGFENVAFMGGSSVASLVFLDIDNIHVMRHSLSKLKESFGFSGTDSSGSTSNSNVDVSVNTMSGSKWLHHVAGLLRGTCAVADSLSLGHSMLVHCSDGWDRTSQLTFLAQIMLDPYYRTIEGFLVLIQKEWCAFGHKFEDRLNRGSHGSKEASPVFIQCLDAVHQLIAQFPHAFEFTEQLLIIVAYCVQSGLMTSFRANNERERYLMIRYGALFEDVVSEDFDYSTISLYIQLLLRTSNNATLIFNPHYTPPLAHEKKVKYIRPRCNNHDMIFWKEGLYGLNNNLIEVNALTEPAVGSKEASAISTDMLARYLSFMDVHGCIQVDSLTSTLQEIIRTCPYPIHAYHQFNADVNKYQQHKFKSLTSCLHRSSSYLYDRKALLGVESSMSRTFLQTRLVAVLKDDDMLISTVGIEMNKVDSDDERESLQKGEEWREDTDIGDSRATLQSIAYIEIRRKAMVENAAILVQLWYRSWLATRLALIVNGVVSLGDVKARPWGSHFTRQQRKVVHSFYMVFYTLSISYLKGKRSLKDYLHNSRARFMRSIVEDVIVNAVDVAQRERLANELAANMMQALNLLDTNASAGSAGSPSALYDANSPKKTLSSRMLRPFSTMLGGKEESRSLSPLPVGREGKEGRVRVESEGGLTRIPTSTGIEEDVNGEGSGKGKSFTKRMMGGLLGGKK